MTFPGVELAESKRIQKRDRASTHRKDVADDAADAGRRALIGLDERRMIVRLDLENRRRVPHRCQRRLHSHRALENLRPLGRERLEVHSRALVAAVLRPHDRKNAELGQVWLAPERPDDRFDIRPAVRPWRSRTGLSIIRVISRIRTHERAYRSPGRADLRFAQTSGFSANTADSNITRPSELAEQPIRRLVLDAASGPRCCEPHCKDLRSLPSTRWGSQRL